LKTLRLAGSFNGRTCFGSGQANLVAFDICNEQNQLKSLLERLPETLKTQMKASIIITRAHKSLLDLGLISMTAQQERTMDALLKGFNTELDNLDGPNSSGVAQIVE
jgi:transcriptional regulatory protein LEU3